MAYDNFENTSFDRDRDGHINSSEAAYIYDTFYKEKDDAGSEAGTWDEEDSEGSGWYPTKQELKAHNEEMEAFRKKIENENRTKYTMPFGLLIIGAILFVINPLLGIAIVFLAITASAFTK